MYLILLTLSVVILCLVTVFYLRSPSASWFHPLTLYIGFHSLVYVIRPIFGYIYEFDRIYYAYGFMPDSYVKNTTLIVANLGFVTFAAVSLYVGNEPFRFRVHAQFEKERLALIRPFLALALALLPFVIYSLYIIWSDKLSGEKSMIMDMSKGVAINVESNGYIKSIQLVGVSMTAIFAWLFRFRLWALMPLAAFVFFRAGTGGRGPFVMTLVCLFCFYLFDKRQRWPDWKFLPYAVGIILFFNVVGQDRGRAVREIVVEEQAEKKTRIYDRSEVKPMEGMDLANMEFLEYLIDVVPRKTGTYDYFLDQLQIFTEPIPRALWKNKPVGQPIALFNLFDYGTPMGMTRSLPGEGWIGLGWIGVAMWCALWGAILGYIYNAYVHSRQTVLQTCAYFSMLPMLIIFYRDGAPITLLKGGLFIVVPIVLWHYVAQAMGTLRASDFEMIDLVQRNRRVRQRLAEFDSAAPANGEDGAFAATEQVPEAAKAAPVARAYRQRAATSATPRAWRRGRELTAR